MSVGKWPIDVVVVVQGEHELLHVVHAASRSAGATSGSLIASSNVVAISHSVVMREPSVVVRLRSSSSLIRFSKATSVSPSAFNNCASADGLGLSFQPAQVVRGLAAMSLSVISFAGSLGPGPTTSAAHLRPRVTFEFARRRVPRATSCDLFVDLLRLGAHRERELRDAVFADFDGRDQFRTLDGLCAL